MAHPLSETEINDLLLNRDYKESIPYQGTLSYSKKIVKDLVFARLYPEKSKEVVEEYKVDYEKNNRVFESFNNALEDLWREGELNPTLYLYHMCKQLSNLQNVLYCLEESIRVGNPYGDTNTEIYCSTVKEIIPHIETAMKLIYKLDGVNPKDNKEEQ